MEYEICRARYSEVRHLLNKGWEPFGVSARDISYHYLNTTTNRQETEHQTTDYIHLRRIKEKR